MVDPDRQEAIWEEAVNDMYVQMTSQGFDLEWVSDLPPADGYRSR